MKITRLYKWTIVLAIALVFPSLAIAQKKVPPPETCSPSPDLTISVVKDADGNFPVQTTCTDPDLGPVPCWVYTYSSSLNGLGGYSQTLPGMGWDQPFAIYALDTFPSIKYSPSPPANGSIHNDKLFWGRGIYERSVIDFTSAPQGDPPKFGYAANQSGVGWTSMKFKIGSNFYYCAIAGPDYEQRRIIKPVTKWVLFNKIRVKFEINYEECTYTATQETDANGDVLNPPRLLPQHPVSDISISIAGTTTGFTREMNSPGKCDESSVAYGDGTCAGWWMGASYVTVCW